MTFYPLSNNRCISQSILIGDRWQHGAPAVRPPDILASAAGDPCRVETEALRWGGAWFTYQPLGRSHWRDVGFFQNLIETSFPRQASSLFAMVSDWNEHLLRFNSTAFLRVTETLALYTTPLTPPMPYIIFPYFCPWLASRLCVQHLMLLLVSIPCCCLFVVCFSVWPSISRLAYLIITTSRALLTFLFTGLPVVTSRIRRNGWAGMPNTLMLEFKFTDCFLYSKIGSASDLD